MLCYALRQMPLLMAIGEHTRANINDALEPVSFARGRRILKQARAAPHGYSTLAFLMCLRVSLTPI